MEEHKGKRSKASKAEDVEETSTLPNDGNGTNDAPEKVTMSGDAVALELQEKLQKEIEECRLKSQEYFDGWTRERADFSNYKKRIEREQSQMYQNATGSVIKKVLPVMDDIERALKNRPTEGEGAAWANGIELISKKFQTILEAEGIQKMPAEKEIFDPTRHEAVMQEENPDYESGQIIEVLQQGYLMGDRVLRPAMVRVAR